MWEILAARAPGWLTNLVRLYFRRPRPDLRIVGIRPTGGSSGRIDFTAEVANYGTQQCRAEFSATVAEREVECRPATADLLLNAAPTRVGVVVPRPELGDLVPELYDATTLYGETLRFEVRAGDHKAKPVTWSEELYDPQTDRARYEVQQRAWRRGRGQETDADRRAEVLWIAEQRLNEQ